MEIVIRPHNRKSISFHELWAYRELFYFLAWRDIKVKYKQTVIGIVWAILQPFLTMVIFSIIFHNIAKVSSGNIPYAVFTFSGLVFWNFFSSSLSAISESFIANKAIITKVYFPRIIIPASAIIVDFVDFFFAFLLLMVILFFFHVSVNVFFLLALIPSLLVFVVTVLGLGLFLATINIKYRDVRYVLPFFIQLLLFLTPVIYPMSLLSKKLSWLFYINPLTGILDFFRSFLFNTPLENPNYLYISLVSALCIFLLGLMIFKNFEENIADII